MAIWTQISLSSIQGLRFDSEYYQPYYLDLLERLEAANPVPIGSFAYVTDGIHSSPQWVEDGGVTYLSAKCVKDNYFALTEAGQISQEQNSLNPRTQARLDDVLITTVGTIGNAAVVYEDVLPANMDRHLGIIRINVDQKDIDPYYLATFLNSKYGRFQTLREATGNVQLNLFIDKIKKLLVPKGNCFNEVGQVTRKAYDKIRESKIFYAQAEETLLDALSLGNIDTLHQISYTTLLSNVLSAKHLDAEYFHPEKMDILEKLSELPGKFIGDYFYSVNDLLNPAKCDEKELVRNYDLNHALRFFLHDDVELTIAKSLGSTKKRFHSGDVVVSRLRSYLKEIAVVATSDGSECVGSSEFIVLRPKDHRVTPELLMVYLRCSYIQKILEWCQSGSNHPRFDEDEILRLKLPDSILNVQEPVQQLIQKGISCLSEAQEMLDKAKHQVEKLIETKA